MSDLPDWPKTKPGFSAACWTKEEGQRWVRYRSTSEFGQENPIATRVTRFADEESVWTMYKEEDAPMGVYFIAFRRTSTPIDPLVLLADVSP